jgi:pimeloyl-ACP methyl ester carboxylesterase
MSRQASDAIHARYNLPAPRAMLGSDTFASVYPQASTRRDPRRERRAPLLLISSGEDQLVPPSLVRAYRREDDEVIAILEFPGRPHFPAAPGWEEVGDHALDWLVEHAGAAGPAGPHRPGAADPQTTG